MYILNVCCHKTITLVDVHVYMVMDVGTDVHETKAVNQLTLVSFEMRWKPNVLTAMLTGRCAL